MLDLGIFFVLCGLRDVILVLLLWISFWIGVSLVLVGIFVVKEVNDVVVIVKLVFNSSVWVILFLYMYKF